MKTSKLTSAACAKAVRDQMRSLVRSKRLGAKDVLQIRRVNNGSVKSS